MNRAKLKAQLWHKLHTSKHLNNIHSKRIPTYIFPTQSNAIESLFSLSKQKHYNNSTHSTRNRQMATLIRHSYDNIANTQNSFISEESIDQTENRCQANNDTTQQQLYPSGNSIISIKDDDMLLQPLKRKADNISIESNIPLLNQNHRVMHIEKYTNYLKEQITQSKSVIATAICDHKDKLQIALCHASEKSYSKASLLLAIKEGNSERVLRLLEKYPDLYSEHFAV